MTEAGFTERPGIDLSVKPNSLVSNSPESNSNMMVNTEIESKMKAELLSELSLDDIRQVVNAVKSGSLNKQEDAPDSFDEYGRNFRRMVHKMEMVGPSGSTYWTERPMANSAAEARKQNPPADYFDINEKVWIWRGIKRSRDYAENTVGFFEETEGKVVPS